MKIWNFFLKYYLLSVSVTAAIGFSLIIGGVTHEGGGIYGGIPTWGFDPLAINVGAGVTGFCLSYL